MHIMNSILPWSFEGGLPGHYLSCLAFIGSLLILVQYPYLLAVTKLEWFRNRRVFRVDYAKGQLAREFKTSVENSFLDAAMLLVILRYGIPHASEANFVSTFAAAYVWNEIWFYVSHRLLHTRLLWPIHRLHHDSKIASPMTAMSFSTLESLTLMGGLWAGMAALSFVYPVSLAGIAVYVAYLHVINFFGHSNVEVYSPKVATVLYFAGSATAHGLHHARVKGNYGLMTSVLDRLMGTYFEDTRAVLDAAYAGRGLTHLGQRLIAKAEVLGPSLEEIRSGRLSLTADHKAAPLFQPLKVYQAGEIAAWLGQEVPSYTAEVSSELISGFDAEQRAWYLKRQDEIFGPMSLKDLSALNQTGSLRTEDSAFSLTLRVSLRPEVLPFFTKQESEAALPELYLNRRKPRTRMQQLVTLKSPAQSVSAMTMDVSQLSSAIYMKTRLNPGDLVKVDFGSIGGDVSFQTDAVVVNVQVFGDGFRCGIVFTNHGARTAAKWNSMIKSKASAA